jgi:hypothetical protein
MIINIMFNIVLMFALFLDKGPEILNFVGIRYVARNMIGLFFICLMLKKARHGDQ